jgi:hypothetical protein
MFKLIVGKTQWLFDGRHVHQRAKFAAEILMRRQHVKTAELVPYGGMIADSIFYKLRSKKVN